jgi:hypothetical protein
VITGFSGSGVRALWYVTPTTMQSIVPPPQIGRMVAGSGAASAGAMTLTSEAAAALPRLLQDW